MATLTQAVQIWRPSSISSAGSNSMLHMQVTGAFKDGVLPKDFFKENNGEGKETAQKQMGVVETLEIRDPDRSLVARNWMTAIVYTIMPTWRKSKSPVLPHKVPQSQLGTCDTALLQRLAQYPVQRILTIQSRTPDVCATSCLPDLLSPGTKFGPTFSFAYAGAAAVNGPHPAAAALPQPSWRQARKVRVNIG